MDASRLAFLAAVLFAFYGVGRLVAGPMSRTGDLMAALFVPPDRTLGWPHGVQEGDDPWAWRAPTPGLEVIAADTPDPPDEAPSEGRVLLDPGRGSGPYVVAVDRVAPIRLTVRRH